MKSNLTAIELRTLRLVGKAGALTSRRVQQECGPRPHWYRLIDERYLSESHTLYGPVLSLTRRSHEFLKTESDGQQPYIMGPATVGDRAYLNDAIRLLIDEGYAVERTDFKGAGGLRHQGQFTDQVTRTILRVPNRVETQLRQMVGPMRKPQANQFGMYPEELGYPSLYVSISSGGIGLARLKRLYRRHHIDIHTWHHPLIVAVPQEEKMRAFLRGLNARDRNLAASSGYPPFSFGLVRLLHVPMPGR